jgi:hypothetical protein
VPSEHDDGDPEDSRIEQLLAGPGKSRRQCSREPSHERSAEHTAEHTAADPRTAMTDPARDREHDADDQAGLEHFTKDNDQRGEHRRLKLLDDQRTPGLLMEIVNKLVPTRRKRTNVYDAFAAGATTFSTLSDTLSNSIGVASRFFTLKTSDLFAGAWISAG